MSKGLKVIVTILFLIYVSFIVRYTIMPYDILNFKFPPFNLERVNIIPFYSIKNYLNHSYTGSFLYIFGNLILLFPFGVFVKIIWNKISIRNALLTGLIISFSIEFIQYFIGRSSDIDDLILNYLGFILGFLITKGIAALLKRKTA